MLSTRQIAVTKDRFVYMPLGGAGEIGMNMYVYGCGPKGREQFVLVDAGVMFPDMETSPGVALIFPDINWLKKHAGRIRGIFLTHAHEDHIGAIPQVLRHVQAPVFARRFTAKIISKKLAEEEMPTSAVRVVENLHRPIQIAPFKIKFVPVPHSIPEASALFIESPLGRVLHTGDFKFDQSPINGTPFDQGAWTAFGDTGIDAMMCDSTNVFVDRPGRSESSIYPAITDLFAEAKGTIAATTFASNVERVRQLAILAGSHGRSVVLLGRAMHTMVDAALKTRVIEDFPPFIEPEEALTMPRNRVLLLTTGSQGEPRSATSHLSRGKFRGFHLTAGDIVLISSRTIPGNERAVARVVNSFSEAGVKVIEDHNEIYHVSGHANRHDLKVLQDLVRPKLVVPMHGEHRHLVEHAELARLNGIRAAVVPNGALLNIMNGEIINERAGENGRLYKDGSGPIQENWDAVQERLNMARFGVVVVSAVFGSHFADAVIDVRCIGLGSDPARPADKLIAEAVEDHLSGLEELNRLSFDKVEREISIAARRAAMQTTGKKPLIRVMMCRL